MTGDARYWTCGKCRSVNQLRFDRCYSCHTPRAIAAVDPAAIPTTGPATLPEPASPATYQSTESRATLLTMAAIVYLLATAAATWLLWRLAQASGPGETESVEDILGARAPILLLPLVFGLLSLAAFGWWISRVIENLPALGAGFSRVSPRYALIEPLIPGVNVYALPTRLAEVADKLEGAGRAQILIAIAWFAVVGPPVALGLWIRFIGYLGEDLGQTLALASFLTLLGQVVGIFLGLLAVWHVEGLAQKRAGSDGSTAAPASGG